MSVKFVSLLSRLTYSPFLSYIDKGICLAHSAVFFMHDGFSVGDVPVSLEIPDVCGIESVVVVKTSWSQLSCFQRFC